MKRGDVIKTGQMPLDDHLEVRVRFWKDGLDGTPEYVCHFYNKEFDGYSDGIYGSLDKCLRAYSERLGRF